MDKVTVVVPVYGTEKYIVECIQSIINQTYLNLEVILVDDESPDNCPQICEEYKAEDPRIKVIHKKNGGLGLVRNSGINACTGKYITFVDSDDWLDADHIEKLVEGIGTGDIAIGSTKICKENGDFVRKRKIDIGNKNLRSIALNMIAPGGKAKNELSIAMSVCFNLYRVDIIKNNNLMFYSERETVSEDLFFNLQYIMHCNDIRIIEEYGYNYRIFEKSITHKYDPKRIERTERYYMLLNQMVNTLGLVEELDFRVERSTIEKFRVALKTVACSDLSIVDRYKIVRSILTNKILKRCLDVFPIAYYRMSLQVVTIFMKYELTLLTIFTYKIRGN